MYLCHLLFSVRGSPACGKKQKDPSDLFGPIGLDPVMVPVYPPLPDLPFEDRTFPSLLNLAARSIKSELRPINININMYYVADWRDMVHQFE